MLQDAAARPAESDGSDTANSSRSVPAAITLTERPVNRVTYAGLRLLTGALAKGWQLTVEGMDNLPTTGPAILAANHVSFIDSPLLMFELRRRVWLMGKAEYLETRLTKALFPALGMIPVDRGGRKAALAAMRSGLGVLEAGECLGIFPEGTRSRDGMLYRGHTGLAWLAFKSGAPIVPVGITGTGEVQPPGSRLPKLRGDCGLKIGEPLEFHRYRPKDRRAYRNLTDDVMFEIAQLSGQRYVDRYAETTSSNGTVPTPRPPD